MTSSPLDRVLALATALLVFACVPQPRLDTLHVRQSSFYKLPSAAVSGVVQQGGSTFVAMPSAVYVFVDNATVHTIAPPRSPWTSITTMRALIGGARWIIVTDQDGCVWRLQPSGEIQEVTDRFGLEGVITAVGSETTTAFVSKQRVAIISDDAHRRDYVVSGRNFAVDDKMFAQVVDQHVELWDLAMKKRMSFNIADAVSLAFFRHRLVVAARNAIYIQIHGGLRRHILKGVRGIAAGERLWVLSHGKLHVLDGDTFRPTDADATDVSALFAGTDGIWLVRNSGLQHYALPVESDADNWRRQVASIFVRSCAECHLPGGAAALDLSTEESWRKYRTRIAMQLSSYAMPPGPAKLSDADRATLLRWLRAAYPQ